LAPAAVGQYFSTHAPLTGRLPDDAEYLVGSEGIDGVTISAGERDGSVIEAAKKMDDFIAASHVCRSYPIVHGVFCGKTGVGDNKMPPSLEAGKKSLGVIDAYQGRFGQAS
jgi:hypothetical protein